MRFHTLSLLTVCAKTDDEAQNCGRSFDCEPLGSPFPTDYAPFAACFWVATSHFLALSNSILIVNIANYRILTQSLRGKGHEGTKRAFSLKRRKSVCLRTTRGDQNNDRPQYHFAY